MNRFLVFGVAALMCGAVNSVALGQDGVLSELYGQGVHEYNSGDYFAAQELFTSAIDQGSRDPRCYYFRGLTYHRIGRSFEGDDDFKTGAALEAKNGDRSNLVSASLERVQGRLRMQIEKQRQLARLAVRSKQNQAQQARFEQMQRSDPNASRRPAAPGTAATPATPSDPEKADPFVDDAQVKPEPSPPRPETVAAEPKAEEADPFGAVTPNTNTPAATPPAAAEMPAEPAADPFSTPATPPAASDASNPFGEEKPADAPPAAEKPAEKPADDPFGL